MSQYSERHFGWLAADVARLMRTVFDRRVKVLGLTRPQWLALVRLKRRPGVSQSELAEMMEIEKAPAGKIVDRMQDKGWVERRQDPTDRRINRIFLTERGEKVHAAIWPIAEGTINDSLADLDSDECAELMRVMTIIKSRLLLLVDNDESPELGWLAEETDDAMAGAEGAST